MAATLRSMRVLIAVQVFVNASSTFRELLARNHLGTTLGCKPHYYDNRRNADRRY